MSPEQATGERTIDGRTDIYSLAAVRTRCSTGEPPHTASTAQAVIARLFTEKARSARLVRATSRHTGRRRSARPREAASGSVRDRRRLRRRAARLRFDRPAASERRHDEAGAAAASRWMFAAALFAARRSGAILMRWRGGSLGATTQGDAPTARASILLAADAPIALANLPPWATTERKSCSRRMDRCSRTSE